MSEKTLQLLADQFGTFRGDNTHRGQAEAMHKVLSVVIEGKDTGPIDEKLEEIAATGRTATPQEWDELDQIADAVLNDEEIPPGLLASERQAEADQRAAELKDARSARRQGSPAPAPSEQRHRVQPAGQTGPVGAEPSHVAEGPQPGDLPAARRPGYQI